jgi:hypothetical protein
MAAVGNAEKKHKNSSISVRYEVVTLASKDLSLLGCDAMSLDEWIWAVPCSARVKGHDH